MTAERCPRCDRPKLWECPEGVIDCRCAKRFPDHCLKGEDCDVNAIDWRARCLAAEAESNRLRKLFDDAGQGEHNILALIDHYQDEEHREYRLRIAAEEVAGHALVEGLAECERLRAMASTLGAGSPT